MSFRYPTTYEYECLYLYLRRTRPVVFFFLLLLFFSKIEQDGKFEAVAAEIAEKNVHLELRYSNLAYLR